jgi:hypothetical protein
LLQLGVNDLSNPDLGYKFIENRKGTKISN